MSKSRHKNKISNFSSEQQNSQLEKNEGELSLPSVQVQFEIPNPIDSTKTQTKILKIQKFNDENTHKIPKSCLILFVCAPSFQGKKVSVFPADPLYVLNPIFPGQKKVYFYNGELLNPNRSFFDCGLSNGNRIVTVPVEQMNLNVEAFWRKATKNSSTDKDRFSGCHNKATKLIFAKNNDLVLFKTESKPNSNRRLLKNLRFLIDDQSSTNCFTNFSYQASSDIPSECLPLPQSWKIDS
jgi:hypothetical protein